MKWMTDEPVPAGNVRLIVREWNVDYDVYFDRVPMVGERVVGPDDSGEVRVDRVVWVFARGLGFPPVPTVRCVP